jgi:exopolysaccharide biosynthesis polyprenyl glycosylphosphotransferase
MVIVYLFWILIFSVSGLYQHWFVRSRLDEVISVFKAISFGIFILFFLIFIDDSVTGSHITSRFLIILYWILMIVIVSSGRLFIRRLQKRLLKKGIGLKNTLVIGMNERAIQIKKMILNYPELGYKLVGFIDIENAQENPGPEFLNYKIGNLNDLHTYVQDYGIKEILIASDPSNKDILMDVINKTSETDIRLKIMPDLYEIISGMAKTQQIYGVPLIEVMPEIMTLRMKIIKRIIDIILSLFILIFLFPVIILTSLIIKLTSEGPVFYIQKRVGKNGKQFKLYKFRSMKKNAEMEGPVWAEKDDPRVTPFGRFLRKIRLDELPQFWNVLLNDMSVVGPRPERPYFVEVLKKEIPYYSRRLRVKPGITGWAQVKYKYDANIEDVKIKLQYDFYYIENMSLTLDIKIMLFTLSVIFRMKGH